MSYILDALRKADAERERDPARGIHAQPVAPLARPPRAGSALGWAGAAALLVAAAGGWFWSQRSGPAQPVPPRAAAALPAVQPVPAAVVPAPTAITVATSVQPAPPTPAAVPPGVAPSLRATARPAAADSPPKPAAAPPAPPAAPALPVAAGGPAEPPKPSAMEAAAAARIHTHAELPQEIQRELPRLVINGGVHSENAAQRMLLVAGQVMSEGAELAPGVVLEQIRPGTAVLRFRGYRYSVPY